MKILRPEVEASMTDEKGFFDIFDNQFMSLWNITGDEYDYICEHASDEELRCLTKHELTFTEKRLALEVRNKYVAQFNEK